MRFPRLSFFVALGLLGALARAQSTTPVLDQPIATQHLVATGNAVTLDLRNYFSVPGVGQDIVQFDTVMGKFFVELLRNDAPLTVANFLGYAGRGAYTKTLVHRTVPGFIVQGGGYALIGNSILEVPKVAPVQNEFKRSNTRGTLAMAKLPPEAPGGGPNSATSEWFVNVGDNSANLDNQNGGFTVFARVLGNGMNIVDAIAALQRVNAGDAFSELPVRPSFNGNLTANDLVIINSITVAPQFPTGGGASLITLSAQSSAPSVVGITLSGSTLTLTPLAAGQSTISIHAADPDGNSADASFIVQVSASAPTLTQQPVSQTVGAGSTVVFSARGTDITRYRWRFNGVDIPGANSATLVISNATGVNAGTYSVVAENPFGSATSNDATLTVTNVAPIAIGRLINLSILTNASAGGGALTMGAVVGPNGSNETLPLVVRAVGPGLSVVGLNSGFLADPQMSLFASSNSTTPIATNDNWGDGGSTQLTAAFDSVGAFRLPAGSLDAAIVRPAPGVTAGGYTVQVSGKGSDSGLVLAEIYDALGTARTGATPRLINVSVLKLLEPGGSMTAGFVIGPATATAKTVLIRAIGPGLRPIGVPAVMSDPQLELFNGAQAKIAANDNWEGETELSIAGASVGAFPITNSRSSDAMLLVTLAPGNYTARVSGIGGGGGNVIIEVYEVP